MKRTLMKLAKIIGISVAGLAFLVASAEFFFATNDLIYEQTHKLDNGETLIAKKTESKSSVLKVVQYRRLTWTVVEDETTLVSYCGNTGFINRVVNFVLGHGATLSGGNTRNGDNHTEFYVGGEQIKNDSAYWGTEIIAAHMEEACANA